MKKDFLDMKKELAYVGGGFFTGHLFGSDLELISSLVLTIIATVGVFLVNKIIKDFKK